MSTLRDLIVEHGVAGGLLTAVIVPTVAVLIVPRLRRDAFAVGRFLRRAWVGNVAVARQRRHHRNVTRTVAQRAASEYMAQTRDEWIRAADAQYRQEPSR